MADDWLDGLVRNVRMLQAQHDGRKVSLVGWSLGGIFAREIARSAPDAVRSVVTLATPFGALGDASHLGMASHPEVLRIVADRLAQPEGKWKALRRVRRPR